MEDYLPVALHWFFETFIRKKNQLELKKNSVSLYATRLTLGLTRNQIDVGSYAEFLISTKSEQNFDEFWNFLSAPFGTVGSTEH